MAPAPPDAGTLSQQLSDALASPILNGIKDVLTNEDVLGVLIALAMVAFVWHIIHSSMGRSTFVGADRYADDDDDDGDPWAGESTSSMRSRAAVMNQRAEMYDRSADLLDEADRNDRKAARLERKGL